MPGMPSSRHRWLVAASLFAALSEPGIARAEDMAALVIVVAGIFVGIPIAILLVASIITSIAIRKNPAPWHRTYAKATMVLAALGALVYPASVVLLDGRLNFLGASVLFDLPNLFLAGIAMHNARRVREALELAEV